MPAPGVVAALPWLTRRAGGVRVALKVTPRAARTAVQGVEIDGDGQGRLALRVSAPPKSGKANVAVVKLLAKRWRVAPGDLELVGGARARHKVLEIRDAPDGLIDRIQAIEGAGAP